jgi:hypothetical protein
VPGGGNRTREDAPRGAMGSGANSTSGSCGAVLVPDETLLTISLVASSWIRQISITTSNEVSLGPVVWTITTTVAVQLHSARGSPQFRVVERARASTGDRPQHQGTAARLEAGHGRRVTMRGLSPQGDSAEARSTGTAERPMSRLEPVRNPFAATRRTAVVSMFKGRPPPVVRGLERPGDVVTLDGWDGSPWLWGMETGGQRLSRSRALSARRCDPTSPAVPGAVEGGHP